MRGMLDVYDLIIDKTKREVESEKKKYEIPTLAPTYVFRNDMRILTSAGQISKIYMGTHRLSDYKNKKTDVEIGAGLRSSIESLAFTDISGGCLSLDTLEG